MPEDIDEDEFLDFVKSRYEARSGFRDYIDEYFYHAIHERSIDIRKLPEEYSAIMDLFLMNRLRVPTLPTAPEPARDIRIVRAVRSPKRLPPRYIPMMYIEDEELPDEDDEDYENIDQSERDREDTTADSLTDK